MINFRQQEVNNFFMKNEVINVVTITPEAAFDYKECLNFGTLNQRQIKKDVAEYIDLQGGKLSAKHYFRCKYLDEKNDEMLILFLYRGNRLSVMQYWLLAGICREEEWNKEYEENGQVRVWLKTKIAELPDDIDEAIVLRAREIIKNTSRTKWKNVLKEVLDGFICKRDKNIAERLAFLQRLYFV